MHDTNLRRDGTPLTSAPGTLSEQYWTAVADLDLVVSQKAARGEPQIRFARAVALFAAGDYEGAEKGFTAASRQQTDLTVAAAAQTMLASTLMYQRKWAALRDLWAESRWRDATNGLLSIAD